LIDEGHADSAALDRITSEVRTIMEDAVKFAIAAPYPNVDEVEKHVYA
jgi:TPP-dependent pyruvate/acetoin dehydrogenase alpha subunit